MTQDTETTFDAVVIGAGFAGLYQLHKLRNELGFRVRLFEKGSGVGGTWFWNKYPGALSDSEAPYYRFTFDDELIKSDTWARRYRDQPELQAYFESVATRFDLWRDIQLNTEITSLTFDEKANTWDVGTKEGKHFTARYVVGALGILSAVNKPKIEGIETFKGQVVHSSEWPEGLGYEGKRVGVIGTGPTGGQIIIQSSKVADHVTVFQRSPQYSVPSGNRDVPTAEVEEIKAKYADVKKQVRNSAVAFGFEEATKSALEVSDEERERVFEEAWERGNGFYFFFGTFSDIGTDPKANEYAASFIRRKIAEIVKDPDTARKLTPHEVYARRPLTNDNYYQVFNQPNVELVSIKETPIEKVTEKGILTSDGKEHELDLLVFATGFDAVDGAYRRIDIRGRNGISINEHWKKQPTSYLGVATAEFPNLLLLAGPYGPFANVPPVVEVQAEFVTDLIKDATSSQPPKVVEVSPQDEQKWTQLNRDVSDKTLFGKVDNWISGANIPGKEPYVAFYVGGLGGYSKYLREEEEGGFKHFHYAHNEKAAAEVPKDKTAVPAVQQTEVPVQA